MSAFIKREQIEDETHYSLRPEGQKAIENVPVLMEKLTNRGMSCLIVISSNSFTDGVE
jgi:hypothetical protein